MPGMSEADHTKASRCRDMTSAIWLRDLSGSNFFHPDVALIFLLSIKSVSKEDTKIFLYKMVFFLKENVFVFLKAPFDYLLLGKHMREI